MLGTIPHAVTTSVSENDPSPPANHDDAWRRAPNSSQVAYDPRNTTGSRWANSSQSFAPTSTVFVFGASHPVIVVANASSPQNASPGYAGLSTCVVTSTCWPRYHPMPAIESVETSATSVTTRAARGRVARVRSRKKRSGERRASRSTLARSRGAMISVPVSVRERRSAPHPAAVARPVGDRARDGTLQHHLVAERGELHVGDVVEHVVVDALADGVDDELLVVQRHRAADVNDDGSVRLGDVRDAERVPVGELVDDVVGELVHPGVLEHVARGEVGVVEREGGVHLGLVGEHPGVLGDVVARAVRLPVALAAATAGAPPLRVDDHVPHLAGVAVPPGEDVAVHGDASADAAGDGDVRHVVRVAVAVEALADDAGVGVVVEVHPVALYELFHGTGERDAVDAIRQVGRIVDSPLCEVQRADATDTRRAYLGRVDARRRARRAQTVEHGLRDDDAGRALWRGTVVGRDDRPLLVGDCRPDVRRTKVDARVVAHLAVQTTACTLNYKHLLVSEFSAVVRSANCSVSRRHAPAATFDGAYRRWTTSKSKNLMNHRVIGLPCGDSATRNGRRSGRTSSRRDGNCSSGGGPRRRTSRT